MRTPGPSHPPGPDPAGVAFPLPGARPGSSRKGLVVIDGVTVVEDSELPDGTDFTVQEQRGRVWVLIKQSVKNDPVVWEQCRRDAERLLRPRAAQGALARH